MLKARVVGVLVVKGGIVVQSIGFHRYLPVGRPTIAVEYLDRWGIDEIALLDVDATPGRRPPDLRTIADCSRFCHVPLAVGGGIDSVRAMEGVIRSGGDKVVVNSAAILEPGLVTEGARSFGSQCIVVSIDARCGATGRLEVFTHSGRRPTGLSPAEAAQIAEEHGAGEILITSIEHDGAKTGYDLELVRSVVDAVKIPVIACGGAGHPRHLLDVLASGASAAAAGNFFHFTEHAVVVAKRYLETNGAPIRLDTYADYARAALGSSGRIAKLGDAELDKLRFEYIPEEVI